MSRILVAYYTRTGNTKRMAEAVVEGAVAAGADVDSRTVEKVDPAELLSYRGIIVGSPVYYGLPAAPVKELFDASVTMHGRLAGKVGGAFASSANTGGGNETTCMAILQMLLVHGMVTVGSAEGDHYGPVSVGAPEDRAIEQCRLLGKRVAVLAKTLDEADIKL